MPGERPVDGGLVNHGYVGEMSSQVNNLILSYFKSVFYLVL
jgi:hypothetical protein